MQYYILDEACATKESGSVFPQIQKWKPGYDEDKADSYYSYLKKSKSGFPDFSPDLDSFMMNGRAKPTDMVSAFTSHGFFISEKLKVIFERHKLVPHRFYPAMVIHKGKSLEGYYWMHIISDLTTFVDYPNSSFFIADTLGFNPKPISLTSKEDYLERSKILNDEFFINKGPYYSISYKSLKLNPQFDCTLEGFKIGLFDPNFYINELIRKEIIEEGITGCSITPAVDLI